MTTRAYAKAGVDIDLGNRVKATLPQLIASTQQPGVLSKAGGFGGLFQLDTRRYKQPVLVSSVDGVGTKLKIAFATGRHDTIGQDLVNHCVNDIAVLGAVPLFFLDYIGTGKLAPAIFTDIIQGFAKACRENKCALIGGETAQMPGFYSPGEYDLSGTIVGVVEKSRILDGSKCRPGDAVIGIASSGLHTNGYSLARKVLLDQMRLPLKKRVPDLGCTLAEEFLKIHVSYAPVAQKLLAKFNQGRSRGVRCLAHITGGGFTDNIPRVLPKELDVVLEKGSWPVLPVFDLIQSGGRISEAEMYQVFNMGIGMVLIVDPQHASSMLRLIRRHHPAWIIGHLSKGKGRVHLAQ